jgi:putative transcriptional regulator
MEMSDNPLIVSALEAERHAAGLQADAPSRIVYVDDPLDVREIRTSLGLTQREFAEKYGFSVSSVQNWEQGRRRPTGVFHNFLKLISAMPAAVERVLNDDCPRAA